MEERHIQRIEAYLTNTLSEAERSMFERDMVEHPEMAREYNRHARAHAVIRHGANQRLKARLAEIDEEMDAPQQMIPRRPAWRKWAVAASVLLIVAVVTWIWADSAYDDTNVANRMFAAVAEETFRGDDVSSPVQRHLAAQALFAAGDLTAARDIYLELVVSDNDLAPRAEWNLLMTYLALGNRTEADKLLEA
ncbi:MAG: hypothetical protein R3330_02280, partial [Saprospiraceae bacterium]|nr:hypothetical protein [Saprospiraceae bacterium]